MQQLPLHIPGFFLDLPNAPNIYTRLTTFASWFAIGNGLAAQVCSFPWTHPSKGPKVGCDNNKQFGAIHWIVQLVINGLDLAWLAASGVMARSEALVGPWLSSACGIVDLILSIVEGVWAANDNQEDLLGTLESVFAAIPSCLKFLHCDLIADASEGTSIVLLFIDACCDVAALGFSIGGAIASFNPPGAVAQPA